MAYKMSCNPNKCPGLLMARLRRPLANEATDLEAVEHTGLQAQKIKSELYMKTIQTSTAKFLVKP